MQGLTIGENTIYHAALNLVTNQLTTNIHEIFNQQLTSFMQGLMIGENTTAALHPKPSWQNN